MPPKKNQKKLAKAVSLASEVSLEPAVHLAAEHGLDFNALPAALSEIKKISITDQNESKIYASLAQWADKVIALIPASPEPEDITSIIQRCGELDFLYQPLMEKCTGLISSAVIANYSTNQLAVILKGLAKLDCYDKTFMPICVAELTRDGKLNEANAHDLSNILWSCAKLRYQDVEFAQRWFGLANEKIRSFTVEDLCQSIQGVAKLEYYDEHFVSGWIERAKGLGERKFSSTSKLNNAYYLTMIKLNSQNLLSDSAKGAIESLILNLIKLIDNEEITTIEEKRQFLISFNFLPEEKKSELNFNLAKLKEDLEAVSTTHVSDLQRNILDKVQKIKLASKQETSEGWRAEHKISLGQKVDSEYWIEEIFNHVDIFVPEIRSVIQVDGHHAHYYRNNGESNATTNFNTKMLTFFGYNIFRGNEGALTKKALKEFLLPLFKAKAADMMAAEARLEELYANDDSESYSLPLLSSSDEEEEGAAEARDSGSSLKTAGAEFLRVAKSSAKLHKIKAEQDADNDTAIEDAILTNKKQEAINTQLLTAVLRHNINDLENYKKYIPTATHPLIVMAVKNNDLDMVKYLLKHHANPNLFDGRGNSAVHIAVEKDNYQMLELLADHDARLNTANNEGKTPLMILKDQWNQEDLKDNILDVTMFFTTHVASSFKAFNYTTMQKNMMLTNVAINGNAKLAAILLQNGASVNHMNRFGNTPLEIASWHGNYEVVKILLQNRASVNAKTHNKNQKMKALHMAVEQGHEKVVSILIENNANVNALNNEGDSPLHMAVEQGHEKVVSILIENNADVNALNNEGDTPLHIVLCYENYSLVPILLAGGADVNALNNRGYTPLHIVSYCENYSVVPILLAGGADVNALNNEGDTPLHMAAREGKKEVVELLLQRDDVLTNIKNKNGNTPLQEAEISGHNLLVDIFMNHFQKDSGSVSADNQDEHRLLQDGVDKISEEKHPLGSTFAAIVGAGDQSKILVDLCDNILFDRGVTIAGDNNSDTDDVSLSGKNGDLEDDPTS